MAAAVAYTASATRLILVLVNATVRVRIDEAALAQGLDRLAHAERGYVFVSLRRPAPPPDDAPSQSDA